MQVILLKDLDTLGQVNEVVSVKPGYARNYLIPQKYAIEASATNMAVAIQREKAKARDAKKLEAMVTEVATKLAESPVKLIAKIGTSGKIFGAVTTTQVARAIREQKGYEVDRKRITLVDEIKEVGTFNATIDLGRAVEFQIEIEGQQIEG
jgi:large subunit ribosomal protein L9